MLTPTNSGTSNATFILYENAYMNFTTAQVLLRSGTTQPLRYSSGAVLTTERSTFLVNTTAVLPSQEAFRSLSLPLQIILSAAMIFIMLVSFLGNFVVCLMVYQKAAMRSAINILLASLAFADMLLAVLNMPFALITIITTHWIFGDIFCRVSAMFFWLFVIEGVAILLIISIDRFLIIVQRQDN